MQGLGEDGLTLQTPPGGGNEQFDSFARRLSEELVELELTFSSGVVEQKGHINFAPSLMNLDITLPPDLGASAVYIEMYTLIGIFFFERAHARTDRYTICGAFFHFHI